MAQYKQSEITNIFWASNDGFKGGRDPLGIQNSSIATYSKLLPGLTNLTKHIRYYSLYCWLLSEYDEQERSGNPTLHQYNFVRRAELIMALIMKEHGIGAVVGALFVLQERVKLIESGVYNIAGGADYDSKDKYWTFRSGALGQYYAGSLIYYELIKIEEGRFYLRNKGKALANAIKISIAEDVRELFLDCILDGRVTNEEIEFLQPLALHRIDRNSEEWTFLNNLLTKNDDGSSLRSETIRLLLSDLSKGVTVENFVKNRFLKVGEYDDIQASFGWYYYYLCEGLHYSIDTLFCLILHKIHELHNPPMEVLTKDIVDSMLELIERSSSYEILNDWKNDVYDNIELLYDELSVLIKQQEYTSSAVYAIKLLLRIYDEYVKNQTAIIDFENKNNLRRQRGILSEGLKSYIEQYLLCPISNTIIALVKQIMQEHTVVAIAKMGRNNSDLRKFIFEDGRVVLVEQRFPVATTPRIDSLINFLQDLGYLDSKNNLTNIAETFLLNYGTE